MLCKKITGVMIAMATIFSGCGGRASGQQVHRCAGAGQWFPANATELRRNVERYLDAAKPEAPKGEIVALVSPHAGYGYSGPIAAYSYATVRGKSYKRVIVLALSHQYPLNCVSALDVDAYETPLGSIPVDRDCVKSLLATKAIESVPNAHWGEWSDENQLPFLQVALKPGWKLVSVLVGQVGESQLEAAAKALRPYMYGDNLIVVGTDFTHLRNTTAAEQNEADLKAAQLLVAKDYKGFIATWSGLQETICGRMPLALLLKMLDADCSGTLLKHAISGEMTRDFSYSVGYCAIAYTTPITKPSEADSKEGAKAGSAASDNPGRPALQSDRFLSGDEEQTLLRLARATLVEWLERGSRKVDLSKFDLTPALRRDAGVFVTLHKHGQLRGCIGHTDPIKPLYEAVIENAINAAANDWRFPTVTKRELADLDIEISVMSPLRKIKSPEEIVIGRHGLMIEKRSRRGIFLPQVPVEQGWNREQYLEEICRKAELPPGSWKEGAELQVFTAQVFGEKEKGAPGGRKQ